MTTEGGSLAARPLLGFEEAVYQHTDAPGHCYYRPTAKVARRRWRWWLAEQVERLALWLGDGVHSLPCDGPCECWQAGWEHEGGR